MSLLIDDAHAQLHQRSVSLDDVILRRRDGRFQGEGEYHQHHGAKKSEWGSWRGDKKAEHSIYRKMARWGSLSMPVALRSCNNAASFMKQPSASDWVLGN